MPDLPSVAVQHFTAGFNCAQSVLMTLAASYGLEQEVAVRLATGFGVGMARGGVCGAVSSAVMVLGLAGGGGGTACAAAKSATYSRAQEFYVRFTELRGSCICRDLIGLDPSMPDGLALARREDRFRRICAGLVHDAVALTLAILSEADLPTPQQ